MDERFAEFYLERELIMDLLLFPQWIFSAIIYGSLILTGAGLITLIVLIWKDYKNGSIW